MEGLLQELRQRRVWRVLVAYPGVAFVSLEAVKFFIDNYGFDGRALTATIIAAVGLLPAALLWNWRHGEAGHQPVTRGEVAAYFLICAATLAGIGWHWQTTPPETPLADAVPPPARSIAVMPFVNANGDEDVQYLCDGIAESLTNWLAGVPDVRVVSKSAAFRLRDQAEDIRAIVDALGVDSVVRGRLEMLNGNVVVSASLVDTRDEAQLWGERLVQPKSDVIYLERSIVNAIKDSLGLQLASSEPGKAASAGTDNPEAYRHYLRGHYLVQTWDADSIRQGIEELREAIALDPKFGLPYADIADAVSQLVYYGIFESDEALIGEARGAAYSAVALAPDTPEAYTAMATMNQYLTFDWASVEAAYEKAIALSSQNPTPFHRYSDYLWATLRFDRAREVARRALEIDPRDGNAMHAVGIAAMFDRDFATAVQAFGEWNRFYPGSRWSYTKHAVALALDGQCDQALMQAGNADAMGRGPPSPLMEGWHAWIYRLCGREDLFQRSRQRIESVEQTGSPRTDGGLFYLYLVEGRDEELIDLILRMIETRSPLTLAMQVPMIDLPGWSAAQAVSRDLRYREAIRRLDFPGHPWTVR
jgi:TolB-like protein